MFDWNMAFLPNTGQDRLSRRPRRFAVARAARCWDRRHVRNARTIFVKGGISYPISYI